VQEPRVWPFLLFQGKAEEAINFYVSWFPGARVQKLVRYEANRGGPEGSMMQASFSIGGQAVMCTDSVVKHDFAFTPSFSFFVEGESEEEIDRL
jgi:predicted 3-demethylubiquinone-9 3-methyltransferase (glyoxalase superfamily)